MGQDTRSKSETKASADCQLKLERPGIYTCEKKGPVRFLVNVFDTVSWYKSPPASTRFRSMSQDKALAPMSSDKFYTDYHLGNTDGEHERLIRQGIRLAPVTERFLREVGIGSGQLVLDLGAGVGDVAMLVARIVGPSGKVVAIERDARTINRARARAADAGLGNIEFVQ